MRNDVKMRITDNISTKKMTSSADAEPSLKFWNAKSYTKILSVCEAKFGPPCVVAYIVSKVFNKSMTRRVTAVMIVGVSKGSVI
ncbi:hypothetical protein D3C80_1986540 [compost metagenome]